MRKAEASSVGLRAFHQREKLQQLEDKEKEGLSSGAQGSKRKKPKTATRLELEMQDHQEPQESQEVQEPQDLERTQDDLHINNYHGPRWSRRLWEKRQGSRGEPFNIE